ncbi:MAG: hypothetical protein AB1540_10615 [Bdellovibrionota bacterium]
MRQALTSHDLPKKAALALATVAAVYGLVVCAPGFRPKHVRDILAGLMNMRGLGVLAYFGIAGLLLPAADRLRRFGFSSTILGSLFILFSILLYADLTLVVFRPAPAIAEWVLRSFYASIAIWGFSNTNAVKNVGRLYGGGARTFFGWLRGWWSKAFVALVLFFFIRQQMHLYLTRGIPFTPSGDELAWWFPMATRTLNEGLVETIRTVHYTPGVGWLIALPARILGVHDTEWLFAYPLFIFFAYFMLLIELSKTPSALFIGICLWFYVFLCSRDLHHTYGASLYGESLSALLLALFLVFLWNLIGGPSTKKQPSRTAFMGFGLFLNFCLLSKPPISVLGHLFIYGFTLYLIAGKARLKQKLASATAFIVPALCGFKFWGFLLLSINGRRSEHSVSIEAFRQSGIDIWLGIGILKGLFNWGAPQFAYNTGLVLALCIAVLCKAQRFLWVSATTLFIYWGFVVGLYSTIWQQIETGSAGRYMSHAAIALILVLPFFLNPRKDALGNDKAFGRDT